MKDLAKKDTNIAIRAIYDKGMKMLTDQKFSISDITAPLIGGLPTFKDFRCTLTAMRAKSEPILPINLSGIDFGLAEYVEYTLTKEGGLFLRFDNKNNSHRIIVWMSDSAIE